MRKHCIGIASASNWSPKFKTSKACKPRSDKLGSTSPNIKSWFPTVKGAERMEGLRHYFHKHMAMLLDARPDVDSWTAQTTPIKLELYGEPVEFKPDFIIDEGHRKRAIRLLRSGVTPSERGRERHGAVARAYREADCHFDVITEEELLSDVRLPIARALFVNRLRDWNQEMPGKLADAWSHRCPIALGEIHRSLGGDAVSWNQLLCLAAFGYLRLDINTGLNAGMAVLGFDVLGYRP
ncbi:hypothetical protein [Acidisphaera sp. L21]|uniref:hypothetical protein n=1 Tax=Acidisphaera sp. L21 TaxID=1641851 RepID=UPI00131E80D4|nr:hypothetical protein [Acidisphaera sp. L21]